MNYNPMGTFSYQIKYGDTLWDLANRYNTTVEEIMKYNPNIQPYNLIVGQYIYIPLADEYSNYQEEDESEKEDYITKPMLFLNYIMRDLWEQIVYWTKMSLTGIVYNLPETDKNLKRLLQIPLRISEVFDPFIGEEKAKEIKFILTDNILITIEFIRAMKANEVENAKVEANKWKENVDKLINFIAKQLPYIDKDELQRMFNNYFELLKKEINTYLKNNFESSIEVVDDLIEQVLNIADYLSDGIVVQYPDFFES